MRYATTIILASAILGCSSIPSPADAQVAIPEGERIIQVSADAQVQRAPDRAVIHLAVETAAPTANEASQRNAETMDQVLAALLRIGIDEEDIRTLRLELHPRYDHRREPDREPEIVGYTAMNQVTVTVDDVTRVGEVVDTGVAAGANRVSGIGFELSDPQAAHHEALRMAIAKARREAEVVASALGERLGPAIHVSTSGYNQPVYRMAPPPAPMMDRIEAAAATPVQPGEIDVHASVSIIFRIGT